MGRSRFPAKISVDEEYHWPSGEKRARVRTLETINAEAKACLRRARAGAREIMRGLARK